MSPEDIEAEIQKIRERNVKVELEKAWETSTARAVSLLAMTYILASLLLIVIKNEHPFINALVPTLGYFLSFQSLPFIKKWWMKRKKQNG